MATLEIPSDFSPTSERGDPHHSLKDEGYEVLGTYCSYRERPDHRLRIQKISFFACPQADESASDSNPDGEQVRTFLSRIEDVFHQVCGGSLAFHAIETEDGCGYMLPVPTRELAQEITRQLECGGQPSNQQLEHDNTDTWQLVVSLSVGAIAFLIFSILLRGWLGG